MRCFLLTAAEVGKALCLLGMLFTNVVARGAEAQATPSPYFHISGNDEGKEHFPLKSTRADVKLNGIIATVKLTQTYNNLGAIPINATYIFPGSTGAAVNGMAMTVGERRVVAAIKEKEEAQASFEKAKSEGKNASLLAQQRPNVFSMDVANIMPGDEVKVELTYTELLDAEEGEYEFVIPGVVGPRYGGDANRTAAPTNWISNPYLATDDVAKDPVNYVINVDIRSPIAIRDLSSKTHTLQIDWQDEKTAKLNLEGDAKAVGNRDFILHYRLQDEKIVSGLTHFTSNGENYFMLVAEPPKKVRAEQVAAREYLFVVDVSGSMHGFPLEVSTQLMQSLLAGLRPTDRFNILFFSGGSRQLSPSPLEASAEHIDSGLQMMRTMRGSGGTELYPALQTALAMPRVEGMSRNIVVITDGYIGAEDAVFRLISDNLSGTSVFTFGIGSSVNRHLIEGLAKAGHAESFVVTSNDDAVTQSKKFLGYIASPVLTGIELKPINADIVGMQPSHIPDLLGERPVLVMGKYIPKNNKPVGFELTGAGVDGKKIWKFTVDPKQRDENLPQLWARKVLEELYVVPRGSREETRETITELGLAYSLLTQYTSFIAVDETIRNTSGDATDVKQPLPLPQGVSNLAVGAHAMPEPETVWMVVMTLCVFAWPMLRGLRRAHV